MTVWKWSVTAGSNDSADSTVNFREGQAPSTINNSTRAVMAAVKKWWLDLGGMTDTAGTASALTIASNQGLSTLTDGFCIAARMHVTNGASPTLQVDSTAAKNVTIAPGFAPSAGMLLIGTVQTFVYDAGNDEWRLIGYLVLDAVFKTGDIKNKVLNVTDAGWVLGAGGTIGNASSGGTARANADTQDLFVGWHKATASQNALYPIQDSAGSASTRTTGGTAGVNALADFNANKRLPLPNLSGRVFAGLDNMSGSSLNLVTNAAADILGGTVGAEKHALVAAENGPHIHGTEPHTHGVHTQLGSANVVSATVNMLVPVGGGPSTSGVTLDNASPNTTSSGSGTAHNNMQPTFFGYVFVKL